MFQIVQFVDSHCADPAVFQTSVYVSYTGTIFYVATLILLILLVLNI
jgi:hypothetical protein